MSEQRKQEVKTFIRIVIICSLLETLVLALLDLFFKVPSPAGAAIGSGYLVFTLCTYVWLLSLNSESSLTRALWVLFALFKYPLIFVFLYLCSREGVLFVTGVVAGILSFIPAAIVHEFRRETKT